MYIITEDSNSARDFWQCVAQTFRSVDSFLLVSFPIGSDGQTASGNTTLKAQVLSIFPKLQAGDKVFVAVWTGSSGGKRNDAEGGCGSTWNLSVLYIKTGKENYAQTSDGNGPV